MEFRENSRAIAAMMLAMAGFILNDTLVKLTSESLPLGQIILVRGAISIVLLGIVCQVTGVFRQIRVLLHPTVAIRAFAELMATVIYLSALFHMPIANATAILQALPLAVTAAGAVFLKIHVGWRRWLAIAVGFAGVLLIVRPGLEGFDAWALLALAGVGFMALRDLITREIPKTAPTFGVALTTIVAVTVLGLGLTVADGWQPMQPSAYLYLSGAACFVLIGYVFIIIAMRTGDIAVVAPFRYSIILWALALGYLTWGDIPDMLTGVGTVIIVATGIYTFFREQRLAKRTARQVKQV